MMTPAPQTETQDGQRSIEARVKRTRILGTRTVVFSAWVPSQLMGAHTSLFSFDDRPGVFWGQIGRERDLPAAVRSLPAMSDARILAAKAAREAAYAQAYPFILAAYPEAADGVRRDGEIEITLPEGA